MMGLDIIAFEHVSLVYAGRWQDDKEGHERRVDGEGLLYLYQHPEFEDRSDGLVEGYYAVEGDSMEFRAGSYSGYNEWRDILSRMAHGKAASAFWNPTTPEEGAFIELINFADNEGFIGPNTSSKLAKDFNMYLHKATQFVDTFGIADGRHFIEKYYKWRDAFDLAQNSGVVNFR